MKTILVTGATGFLGGNLIKRLSGKGYRLLALVRDKGGKATPGKRGWDGFLNGGGNGERLGDVELVQGDITLPLLGLPSRRFRRLAWQVSAIFHSAALTDFTDRTHLFRTNVEGTRHLLQFALLGRKKHFHHISSAYVAGKFRGTFCEEDFNKNQGFNNSYEESKFNSETMVRRFAGEHLLPFTVYRPSIIVGDSETGHTQCYKGFYAFARALFLIKERFLKRHVGHSGEASRGTVCRVPTKVTPVEIPMRVFGVPDALINLVPVDYVAEAISEISKRPEAQGKTFHLTNPHPLTLAQLADKTSQALGIEGVEPWYQDGGVMGPSTHSQDKGAGLDGDLNPVAHDRTRLSPTERLFLHYTRPYIPYLQSHLSFDTSNTMNVLNGTVTCPKITRSLVSLLINKAVEDRWGMRETAGARCNVPLPTDEEVALATAVGDSVCGVT
ncbi:MAG: SDR family oxidoreductase [Candidatus Brocadiaceae bacterium]|nr:SDR family oxidoreductase [Candidatus Brocadiaceae bacterium]